jgi:hypothetical protein
MVEEYSQSALDQFSHEKEQFFLPLQRPFDECCASCLDLLKCMVLLGLILFVL